MERFDGVQLPEANVVWKRNTCVFALTGTWTESASAADGSITYTATAIGNVTCEWEGGKKETDKNLPANTVVVYWPDSGKVSIKVP